MSDDGDDWEFWYVLAFPLGIALELGEVSDTHTSSGHGLARSPVINLT